MVTIGPQISVVMSKDFLLLQSDYTGYIGKHVGIFISI